MDNFGNWNLTYILTLISPGQLTLVLLAIMLLALFVLHRIISCLITRRRKARLADLLDLTPEEKALLCFFAAYPEGLSLNDHNAVVRSLMNRNLIEIPRPLTWVIGSDYEHFSLTQSAKRRLYSAKLQSYLCYGLNEDDAVAFVNSISRRRYKFRKPSKLGY